MTDANLVKKSFKGHPKKAGAWKQEAQSGFFVAQTALDPDLCTHMCPRARTHTHQQTWLGDLVVFYDTRVLLIYPPLKQK